jgi:hypothetical protein
MSVRFIEPCGLPGTSPHQSTFPEAGGTSQPDSRFSSRRRRTARDLPGLPVAVDRHDGKNSGRRDVLALHEVRRGLERLAIAESLPGRPPVALKSASQAIRRP